jgi:DNA-binding NarL/FixJ family response regulator
MKLLIVEDQHLIRDMLVLACRRAYPEAFIHEASTARECIDQFRLVEPDLILLDILLPDGDGITLADQLRQTDNRVRIIALSSNLNEYTLHRAQFAGINGFVDKNVQTFEVVREAIATVMDGRPYICSEVRETRSRMRESARCFSNLLSNREMELLVQIGRGCTNDDIGRAFGLSTKTVCNHRQNIMNKLGINSSVQLLRYAVEKGFAQAPDGAPPARTSPRPWAGP